MKALNLWAEDYEQRFSALESSKKEFDEDFPKDIKVVLADPSYDLQEFFEILKKRDYALLYGNEAMLLGLIQSMVDYWQASENSAKIDDCWKEIFSAMSSEIMSAWMERVCDDDEAQELVSKTIGALASIDFSLCEPEESENIICDVEAIDFFGTMLEENCECYTNLIDEIEAQMCHRDDDVAIKVLRIIEKCQG